MLPRAHIFRQTTVQFLSIFIVFNTYRIQNSMASKSQSESSSSQLMSSSSQKEGGTSLKRKNNFFYTVSFWRSRCPGGLPMWAKWRSLFFFIYILLSLSIYIYIFRHWLLSWFPHAWIYPCNSHPFGTQTSDNNESRHTSPKSVKYPNESIKSNFFFLQI